MPNHVFAAIASIAAAAYSRVPQWIFGLLLLIVAAVVAASLCRWVIRGLRRFTARFGAFPAMLLARSQGPCCTLLVLFALGIVLPAAPFSAGVALTIGHALLAAFVLLIGWGAIVALDLASELYIKRFRTDVEDNLLARKHVTQVRILRGALRTLIVLVAIGAALMTSAAVRQYGISLFASAGAAGLVVGLAARPVLANLLAGIQIAMTQPIRLEDAVIVEGEWGWIEEIRSTYVVIRIWDLRRLIVPLSYFIEKPFQNWTYQSADLLGSVYLYVDYTVPVDRIREKLKEVAASSDAWDGKVAVVQVTDTTGTMVQLRVLVSARNSGQTWNVRCDVREKLLAWLQREYPASLPRQRLEIHDARQKEMAD